MRPLILMWLLIVGCSSDNAGGDSSSSQHASLHVVFGSTAVDLETSATISATTSRLLLQSMDADTTVFVSLALPIQGQRIALSSSAETASVWAKHDAMQPLIATSGALTVETADSISSFVFEDVAKPADSFGESLQITGTITGVSAPQ